MKLEYGRSSKQAKQKLEAAAACLQLLDADTAVVPSESYKAVKGDT